MVNKSSACGPAPFLTKTYEMVDDDTTNDVISWGPSGASFVVWKPVEFARDLLPLHFKHSNFSSFVRQLNTYGFRKVVPDRWEFGNDNFRRGEQILLSDIRRRKTAPPQIPTNRNQPNLPTSSILNSTEMHSSSSTSSPPLPTLSNYLIELSNENEILKRDNQSLNNELARAKRHLDELVGFLSNFIDVSKLDFDKLVQLEEQEVCVKEQEGGIKEKEKGLKIFGVLLKGLEGDESDSNVVQRGEGVKVKVWKRGKQR